MSATSPPPRWASWLVAAGVCAWLVGAVIGWTSEPRLGHDEAQYAISARDLADGHDPRWFYLSRGMAYIGLPGVEAGGGELAMRFMPLVLGLGFLAAAWMLARAAFGAVTAAWAVVVLAASPYHVSKTCDLLSDLPAATFLIAAAAVIAGELTRDRLRWRIVVIAPLFAAAFYVRYASCVPIALMCVAWVALGWRAIVRRPWPAVAAAVVFALLWLPHLREAARLTGSPLGILLDSRGVASHGRGDESLLPYFAMDPIRSYGAIVVPFLVCGLAAVIAKHGRRDRRVWFVWSAAVSSIVVVGWVGVIQARYVVFGITLLAVLGVDTMRALLASVSPRARRVIAIVALVIAAFSISSVIVRQADFGARRGRSVSAEVAAARAIRIHREQLAAGTGRKESTGCVVAGDSYTQLEWYSGCAAEGFAGYDPHARGEPLYVVTMPDDRYQRWTVANKAYAPHERHVPVLILPGIVSVTRVLP